MSSSCSPPSCLLSSSTESSGLQSDVCSSQRCFSSGSSRRRRRSSRRRRRGAPRDGHEVLVRRPVRRPHVRASRNDLPPGGRSGKHEQRGPSSTPSFPCLQQHSVLPPTSPHHRLPPSAAFPCRRPLAARNPTARRALPPVPPTTSPRRVTLRRLVLRGTLLHALGVFAISFFTPSTHDWKEAVHLYTHHDSKGNLRQPYVYHLDGKRCEGLSEREFEDVVSAEEGVGAMAPRSEEEHGRADGRTDGPRATPLGKIRVEVRQCEWACYINSTCEAWQMRNHTCYLGTVASYLQCDGKRDYYSCGDGDAEAWMQDEGMRERRKRGLLDADEEKAFHDWEQRTARAERAGGRLAQAASRGEGPGGPGLNEKKSVSGGELCRSVAPYFNNQVLGARLRWMQNLEFNSETYGDKYAMRFYSYHGVMGGICYLEDGRFCPPKQQVNERIFRKIRFQYRVGYNVDAVSHGLCQDDGGQREAVKRTQWSWDRDDGRDLADKAILKLRAGIPTSWRSGKFLNFGIGRADPGDPMYFLFFNQKRVKAKLERLRRETRDDRIAALAEERLAQAGAAAAEKASAKNVVGEGDGEEEHDDEHYAAAMFGDFNHPPWHGFGFELYAKVAENVRYDNTTVVLSKVSPANMRSLMAKTGFFPSLLVDSSVDWHLRKNPGVDPAVLAEEYWRKERAFTEQDPGGSAHIMVIPHEIKGDGPEELDDSSVDGYAPAAFFPRPERAAIQFEVKALKTTLGAPELITNRSQIEDVIRKTWGSREQLRDYQNNDVDWRIAQSRFAEGLGAEVPKTHTTPSGGAHDDGEPVPPPWIKSAIELVVIDLDAFDFQILEFLVRDVTEKVLVFRLEVAQHFPPPYKYSMLWHPKKVDLYREHMK